MTIIPIDNKEWIGHASLSNVPEDLHHNCLSHPLKYIFYIRNYFIEKIDINVCISIVYWTIFISIIIKLRIKPQKLKISKNF